MQMRLNSSSEHVDSQIYGLYESNIVLFTDMAMLEVSEVCESLVVRHRYIGYTNAKCVSGPVRSRTTVSVLRAFIRKRASCSVKLCVSVPRAVQSEVDECNHFAKHQGVN